MLDDRTETVAPFMEVLTADRSAETVGYRLPGMRSGLNIVIAVALQLMEPLTKRFAALPTLPWMRSALDIVDLDAVADGAWRSARPIDATLSLLSHPSSDYAARDG